MLLFCKNIMNGNVVLFKNPSQHARLSINHSVCPPTDKAQGFNHSDQGDLSVERVLVPHFCLFAARLGFSFSSEDLCFSFMPKLIHSQPLCSLCATCSLLHGHALIRNTHAIQRAL